VQYFTLISAFNFFIFALVLFAKKSPIKKANNVMGVTFTLMAIYDLFSGFASHAYNTNNTYYLSLYFPLDYIVNLFFGPLIFIYLNIFITKNFKILSFKNLIGLIPIIPSFGFFIWFCMQNEQSRIDYLLQFKTTLPWEISTINSIFFIQLTAYIFICFHQITKQIKQSKTVIINHISVNIVWLKTYFRIVLLILIISAPICIVINNDNFNTLVAQIAINIQFFYIFIRTIWNNGIFKEEPTNIINSTHQATDIEYFTNNIESNSIIPEETASEYLDTITKLMKQKKYYLKSGCSITEIAKLTEIPVHHLSHILNTRLNKNFFDYINEFRIEDAKQILRDPNYENYTLESIGYKCGFGSKTSFNKAFKKYTNQTPSEYRQK